MVVWRGVEWLPARILLHGDEDDGEEVAGHGGGAGRSHWPRELTAMATAALMRDCTGEGEARKGEMAPDLAAGCTGVPLSTRRPL